ncbi:tail fiber domain-containing protein [Agromyces larvae]|uniref:Tail fiber domain-containing protein n=1 Tax=Agromyces larvae TaxID=2929802 RepID=A0ABY4BXX8_9MICO|nr:tail fiber domain-containing protein [Agromyces larvae]UOE43749.1 tail fiber domain-containing protein [Agromyces larvae]
MSDPVWFPTAGDDAASAGMDTMTGLEKRKDVWRWINHALDYIAQRTSAILSIAMGGTGASTAAGARTNLDVPSTGDLTAGLAGKANTSHTHSYPQIGPGAINNGGFGLTVGAANITGNLTNLPGRNTPVTSSYVSAYFNADGRLGADPSAARFKQDIDAHGYTLDQLLAINIVTYRLRAAVDELGDEADTLVGVIAEQLVDAGLAEFVNFDPDGEPFNVAYERLALVAIGALQDLARRFDDFEARLSALEGAA